jgi:hypothetical protein|tara:strand:+ start:271 stop:924 length:654 start_codon:yes stop_codon:yes gene_type:complete
MAISSNDIIGKAQIILQDESAVRWTTTELLSWLNDGQREVCLLKPSVSATNQSVTMVAGTKQSIPAGGLQVLRVVRNLSSAGAGGKVVRVIDRDVLDTRKPLWHSEYAAAIVDHYTFDELDPRTFYVYPPNDGNGFIEAVYAVEPTQVASGGNISIPDIHANNLLDYILYRAYAKETDQAGNQQRSSQHYKALANSLGIKIQLDSVASPNMRTVAQV